MESGLRYGGFTIYHDGTQFVAQVDSGDDPILEIASQSVDRLIALIDEHNHYNEHVAPRDPSFDLAPEWLREWYFRPAVIEPSEDALLWMGGTFPARIDADRVKIPVKETTQKADNPQLDRVRSLWENYASSQLIKDKLLKIDCCSKPYLFNTKLNRKSSGSFKPDLNLYFLSRHGLEETKDFVIITTKVG